MGKIEGFEDLRTWQLGREICGDIWNLISNSTLGKDY